MESYLFAFWNHFVSLRFLIVGGWNFLFGYSVFAGLYWLLNGLWADWSITAAGTVLGITMSFVTHRFLTFRSHGCWWREYLRFYVVYGVQSLLNLALIVIFVTYLKMNAYIVQLFILLAMTVFSYWAHKYFSFGKKLRESNNEKI